MAACVPSHRRALRIAVETIAGHELLERVADAIGWDRHLLHADLIAGIKERRPLECERQQGSIARLRSADRARQALLVVSADHPIRPSMVRNCVVIGIDVRLQAKRTPFGVEQSKIQRQVKARAIIAIEMTDTIYLPLYFAGEHAIRKLVHYRADLFQIAH